jgi:medium-chain acyl-[acyl-carrier-protein] hydrolase
MNNPPSRWFHRYEERPNAQVRLLCFAHAGGSATAYATWHRELPAGIELCAVKLPGRDDRRTEAHRVSIPPLIGELHEELRPLFDRPVALFGYSLGALLAFEFAKSVRASGLAHPLHLFAAARKAPQWPLEGSIAGLSDARFVQEMDRRYGGIPAQIANDPELLAYFLPTIRADVTLLESYRYVADEPLDCPITVFAGESDPQTRPETLEGWGLHTRGGFEVKRLPGGHFFITQSRRAMSDAIAKALLGGTTMAAGPAGF